MLHGRSTVGALERERLGERDVHAALGDHSLGEHGVRAGRVRGHPEGDRRRRRPDGDQVPARARVLDHARDPGRHAARDDERLRDARRPRVAAPGLAAGAGRHRRRRDRPPDRRARQAGPAAERRRPHHVRARDGDRERHRHRRRHRATSRGQDRHRAGVLGRVVLRLRPAARDLRVGGLPAGRDPTRGRRGFLGRVRRHDPGAHLARLHVAGDSRHADQGLRRAVVRGLHGRRAEPAAASRAVGRAVSQAEPVARA